MTSTIALKEIDQADRTQTLISERAQDLARFYRGLGDPTRLKLLKLLSSGEKSVS